MFFYADMANSTVKFDEKGDGLARYTIFNYQKKLEGAGYDYKVSLSPARGSRQRLEGEPESS